MACLVFGALVIGASPEGGVMGKRARLKKQAKVEKLLEQRQQVEQRKVVARSPMIQLTKRFFLVLIVTIALLYVGQAINQKIAKAESKIEAVK